LPKRRGTYANQRGPLASAKLNGPDPEAYLADVVDRMAKDHPINRLAELLQRN